MMKQVAGLPSVCRELDGGFLSLSSHEKETPRIYFLLCGDEVVYIGQTQGPWPQRVCQHLYLGEKIFDAVWYFELCDHRKLPKPTDRDGFRWSHVGDATTQRLKQMESYYIDMFQPRYNHAALGSQLEADK